MKRFIIIFLAIGAIFYATTAQANITSVRVTPATPATLTNARAYYLAGVSYTFRVQAADPSATGKTYWNQITVNIREGATTRESFGVNIGPDTSFVTVPGGIIIDNVVDQSGGVYTSIDYLITVRFLWNCTAFTAGSNTVSATVSIDAGGPPPLSGTDAKTFSFGVISEIRILKFAQSGDASDARITPWHNNFDVTGQVVYYDSGRPADLIANLVPVSEITAVYLYRAKTLPAAVPAADTGLGNSGTDNDVIFTIDQTFLGPAGRPGNLGVYRWDIRATMAAGGVTKTSNNTLDVRMDEVQIDSFVFEAGGGVDPAAAPANYYVRSVNVTGTRIRVGASMRSGITTPMAGNTTFAISDGTNTYNLTISNGQSQGTVLINPLPTVALGANIPVNYTVGSIFGGYYDSGQDDSSKIVGSTGYSCRWENHHPPGNQAGTFTNHSGTDTATATTFTVNWDILTVNPPNYDHDFSSYRIYFREAGTTDWLMLDKSAVNYSPLGSIARGSCTVGSTDNPLKVLTTYDYRISAIDIWGNEVPLARQITGTVATTAYSVEASISDGISKYNNSDFNNHDPAAHPVRDTGIKVTVRILTSGSIPDKVNVIFASNDSDVPGAWPSGQYGATGAYDSILSLRTADPGQVWSIPCVKVTANTWEAVISSEHQLMKYGSSIRFIVETISSGNSPTYSDHTEDPSTSTGNYWADEWRFRVEKKAVFIPWPTRVLNNVMTSTLPCCYPAYFVPVDSLVTIKVYDIKGRVIATLSEKRFRPGGQNIKDLGWCGLNKDNRRVGPGLYYIEIKATTFGNKTVIDKIMKVVVEH